MFRRSLGALVAAGVVWSGSSEAQPPASAAPAARKAAPTRPAAGGAPAAGASTMPEVYVIGMDDMLAVVFWRDKDMSADVVVRPDGKITLPLINDIDAAGLTPDQLREKIEIEATRFVEDPAVAVIVKQINSRKVFITGEVQKPGPYPLTSPMTVMQLLALTGGLRDYAQRKNIVIMRTDGGRQVTLPFDYDAVLKGTKLQQNILLKPGDTVVVP